MKELVECVTKEISVDDITSNNIIALIFENEVFILTEINHVFAWSDNTSCDGGYNGSHDTFKQAIDSVINKENVYVFESTEELYKWAIDSII